MPNQDALRFVVQVGFSLIVLCFCLLKLGNSDSQSNALYWGGVTSVLAWWMPTPGGNAAPRHFDRADAGNASQVEKIESLSQINHLKN
jgi:hypothetical protein